MKLNLVLASVSCISLIVLVHSYPTESDRIRRSRGESWVDTPTAADLRARLGTELPDTQGLDLRLVYAPPREPRSGIARVYALTREGAEAQAVLFVLRHDITCRVCTDVLAGAVFVRSGELVKTFLLKDWEVSGDPVLTVGFLRQLRGRGPWSIDGITGATSSCDGLVEQVNAAAAWLEMARSGS